MSFRIDVTQPIADEIRRIGLEQLDRMRRSLAGRKDPATDVHDARKALKRTRSLLRLTREIIGDDTYRAENRRLRDIGQGLAGQRDMHVMHLTLGTLHAADPTAKRRAFTETGKRLRAALDARPSDTGAGPVAAALEALDVVHADWSAAPLTVDGAADLEDALLAGLARTYRQGRRAVAAAQASGDDEAYHVARKAIQHHGRHMSLLSPAWPEYFAARAGACRELAQMLGEDHDLAVLRAFVAADAAADGGLGAAHAAAIDEVCSNRQADLRSRAAPWAARLLAIPPRALVREIAAVLASARKMRV